MQKAAINERKRLKLKLIMVLAFFNHHRAAANKTRLKMTTQNARLFWGLKTRRKMMS
jgi:hypothetical protein